MTYPIWELFVFAYELAHRQNKLKAQEWVIFEQGPTKQDGSLDAVDFWAKGAMVLEEAFTIRIGHIPLVTQITQMTSACGFGIHMRKTL